MTLRVAIGFGSLAVAANLPPDQPTITGGVIGGTNWSLSSSTFSDPDSGDTHLNSDWQVTTAGDTGFASPVWQSLATTANKTSVQVTGLANSTIYIARVRYRDNHGAVSDYSSTVTDTTEASSGASVYEDGFETGDMSYTGNGFSWSQGSMSPSTDRAYAGNYSLKFVFGPDANLEDSWQEQRFNLGTPCPEIWLEYRIWIPANYYQRTQSAGGNNNKFFCMWDSGDYHGGAPGAMQWFLETWPDGSGNSSLQFLWGDQYQFWGGGTLPNFILAADKGAWMRIRCHSKPSTYKGASPLDGDGIFEMWKNDEKWFDRNDLNWTHETEEFWQRGYVMGYCNTGFLDETSFYVDEIKWFTSNPGW